jgi:hypothetical protein
MMERFPLQGCKKVTADKNNKNKVKPYKFVVFTPLG